MNLGQSNQATLSVMYDQEDIDVEVNAKLLLSYSERMEIHA